MPLCFSASLGFSIPLDLVFLWIFPLFPNPYETARLLLVSSCVFLNKAICFLNGYFIIKLATEILNNWINRNIFFFL